MFYIVLILLILLGVTALVLVIQNIAALLASNVHLTIIAWHLPGIPVILLCVLALCLGGLLLYVVSSFAARHDDQEIKKLRARIEELEQAEQRTPSGPLRPGFAPPVVPIPGLAPTNIAPLRQPQGRPPQLATPSAPPPHMSAPNGPFAQPQQPPARTTQNLAPFPPSAAPNNSFPPAQQQPPMRITQNLAPAPPPASMPIIGGGGGGLFANPQQPPTGPARNAHPSAPNPSPNSSGLFANPQWMQMGPRPPSSFQNSMGNR